jgi:hypothetical protein
LGKIGKNVHLICAAECKCAFLGNISLSNIRSSQV